MTEETDAPEPIETEVKDEATDVAPSEAPEVEEELKPEEGSESSPEAEEKPKANSASKRIDELTKKRRDAERDRDYWRQQAMSNQPEKPKDPVDEPLKTLADFEYDEAKYQQHIFDKARSGAVEEAQRVIKEDQSQQTSTRRVASFEAKELEFAKSVDDYQDVARDNDLPVTQVMADVVTEMDNGPEVLYYLGKNPDLAYEIAQMPGLTAARELGRIEAKIQLQEKKGEKVSKAPVPTPKIEAGTPAIGKKVDDMTQREFNAHRRKVIAKRGH